MSVKKVKTTVQMAILSEWAVDQVKYYRIDFSAGNMETQTVITQHSRTFEMREPSRFARQMSGDTTAIITGTPFWNMLNNLLSFGNTHAQFDILVSQDEEDEDKYHLEITANTTEHMRSYSVIEYRKSNFALCGFNEEYGPIPNTSGWWVFVKHAIDTYHDIQNRVVCD